MDLSIKNMARPEEPPPVLLMIGIPTRGDFRRDTVMSLMDMIWDIAQGPVNVAGVERPFLWAVRAITSSILPAKRQKCVDLALSSRTTHLLFIDDDMSFDGSLARQWVEADRGVIAANCPIRSVPCFPTARYKSNDGRGSQVYSDVAKTRFEPVWRVGTGIMMLQRSVLEQLPRPCFTPRWCPEIDDYNGEDWALCEELEKLNIPIYVDHKVSWSVGHVGETAFTHDIVTATRKAFATKAAAASV